MRRRNRPDSGGQYVTEGEDVLPRASGRSRWALRMRAVIVAEAYLVKIEELVIFVAVIGLVVDLTAQVLSRYVLPTPLAYTVELSRVLLIWLVFFGAARALYAGRHFSVRILIDQMPPAIRQAVDTLLQGVVAAFLVVLVVYGIAITWNNPQIYPALGMPVAISYVALPLSGAVMLMHVAMWLVCEWLGIERRDPTFVESE